MHVSLFVLNNTYTFSIKLSPLNLRHKSAHMLGIQVEKSINEKCAEGEGIFVDLDLFFSLLLT